MANVQEKVYFHAQLRTAKGVAVEEPDWAVSMDYQRTSLSPAGYDLYTRQYSSQDVLRDVFLRPSLTALAAADLPLGGTVRRTLDAQAASGRSAINIDWASVETAVAQSVIASNIGRGVYDVTVDEAARAVVDNGVVFQGSFQPRVRDIFGNLYTWPAMVVNSTGTNQTSIPPVATGIGGVVSMSEDSVTPSAATLLAVTQGGGIGDFELLTPPADVFYSFDPVAGILTWHPNARFETLQFGQTATRDFTWRPTATGGAPGLPITSTLTIVGVNDAPLASDVTVQIDSTQTVFTGLLPWSDIDNGLFSGAAFEFVGNLTDSIGGSTGIGQATLINNITGQWRYETLADYDAVPDDEYDVLTQQYRVRDALGLWSAARTLTIIVRGKLGNAPPVIDNTGLLQVQAGNQLTVDLEARTSDADGDVDFFEILIPPSAGSAQLIAGTTLPTGALRFTTGTAFDALLPGSSTTVTVRVRANDTRGNIDEKTLTIQVSRAALPAQGPQLQSLSLTVEAGQSVNFQLFATDPDGDLDPNGFSLVTQAVAGVATVNATGSGSFSAVTGFSGLLYGQFQDVAFTVRASDLGGRTVTAQVTVRVTRNVAYGSPPVIMQRTFFVDYQDTAFAFDISSAGTDPDGDFNPLSWVKIADSLNDNPGASFALNSDGTGTFTLGGNYTGLSAGASTTEELEVQAADTGGNLSPLVGIRFVIRNTNVTPAVAPVAADQARSVNNDATIADGQVTATDADSDLNATGYALFGSGLNAATDGVLVFNANGSWTYNPNGLFNNLYATPVAQSTTRSFQFTASDAGGRVSTPKTVTITINGTGAAPGGAEPVYPEFTALNANYPWEAAAMTRMAEFMANYPTTVMSAQSGNWSDTATWMGGVVPAADANVMIEWPHVVTFDLGRSADPLDDRLFKMVYVHGTLQFATGASQRLRCDTLMGMYGAHLAMKPANASVIHELLFENAADINPALDPTLLSRGLMWMGTRDQQGTAKDPRGYAALGSLPSAGATSITLQAAPVGWAVGDRIVIPGATRGNIRPPFYAPSEHDDVTITAIAGAVVTFTPALVFSKTALVTTPTHAVAYPGFAGAGGDTAQLAVINLTRNVKIGGRLANAPFQRRPHCMSMLRPDGAGVIRKYVQYDQCGRTNKMTRAFNTQEWTANFGAMTATANLKGRYAEHDHWVGYNPTTDVSGTPSVLEGCAFWDSPGWWYGQHRGAANVYDNVGLLVTGAGFVSETGDETGVWGGNIGVDLRARRLGNGAEMDPKNGLFYNNHDNGTSGSLYHFLSRLIEVKRSPGGHWSWAYGSDNRAYLWQHRTVYASTTSATGAHTVNGARHAPAEAVSFARGLAPDRIPLKVAAIGAVGCWQGLEVIKEYGAQNHDERTFLTDIIFVGVQFGILYQYTGHYTTQRFLLSATQSPIGYQNAWSRGVSLQNDLFDMHHRDGKIGGFRETGIEAFHRFEPAATRAQPIGGAFQHVFDNIAFGAAVGLVNNTNNYRDYAPTRTGQDGVARTEDRLFNMTLNGTTYGAPPNPAGTLIHDIKLYQGNSTTEATVWNYSPGNYAWRGTVTDRWGVREVPAYYGVNGSLLDDPGSLTQYDYMDIHWRSRGARTPVEESAVAALLRVNGYWRTSVSGPPYVEDPLVLTARDGTQVTVIKRLMLGADVPGVTAAPSAFFGNGATFVYNGVKP